MTAVGYWFRATFRQRARSAVLVVLLLAIGGGCSLAAAAGARRSASSLDRFEAELPSFDGAATAEDEGAMEAALGLDGIADHQRFHLVGLLPADRPCGSYRAADFFPITVNEGNPYRLDRPHVVSGRLPDQSRTDEVALPAPVADRLGLAAGGTLRLGLPADEPACDGITIPQWVETYEFRVVGITRRASEIGAVPEDFAVTPLTEAFARAHPDLPDISGPVALVELEPDADRLELLEAADDVGAELDFTFLVGSRVQGAVDTIAAGLWLCAAVLAGATVLGLGLALVRLARVVDDDLRVLRAIGVDRRGRTLVAALTGLSAVVLGVLTALGLSALLSPLHPIGVARQAELHPGVDLDGTVALAGGGIAVVVGAALAGLGGLLVGRRSHRGDAPRRRARGLAGRLAQAGVPPWTVLGVAYATDGGRPEDVPGRAAVLGATVGVAGIVAALLFAGSLDATLDQPARYGWGDFDASVGLAEAEGEPRNQPDEEVLTRLLDEPGSAVATVYERREVRLDGEVVSGSFLELHAGSAGFTVAAGRRPTGPGEIALGAETADDLGVAVGDRVRAEPTDGSGGAMLSIVGLAAFPASEDSMPLAVGFVADLAAAEAIGDDLECLEYEECGTSHWVAFGPGIEPLDAIAALEEEGYEVSLPRPGAEVSRLREVSDMPTALAIALAVLAAAGMLHALVATPTRRRHELATLGALGFRRRQLVGVVGAEGLTIGVLGGLCGLLAGWPLGRAAWGQVAAGVGVPGRPDVAGLLLLGVAAGTAVLGVGLAGVPARRLRRMVPAAGLRDEA